MCYPRFYVYRVRQYSQSQWKVGASVWHLFVIGLDGVSIGSVCHRPVNSTFVTNEVAAWMDQQRQLQACITHTEQCNKDGVRQDTDIWRSRSLCVEWITGRRSRNYKCGKGSEGKAISTNLAWRRRKNRKGTDMGWSKEIQFLHAPRGAKNRRRAMLQL